MSELTEDIAKFLKVLGDATRLEILELLKETEKTSEEIQKVLDRSQSTISQQLKTLIDAELIGFKKKGNVNYYNIKNDYIFKILNFVQSFVITLKKEEVKRIAELDIHDTLF